MDSRDEAAESPSASRSGLSSHLWHELHDEARRRGADEHSAEDVAQETLLRALERRPDESNLKGWLHVVARNLAWKLNRSQRHREQREATVARGMTVESPAAGDEGSGLLNWVQDLDSPYREVVRLRYLEDRDIGEIASLLGRPPVTVRSQLKRGLDRLRARLAESEARRRRSPLIAFLLGLREDVLRPGRTRARWLWGGAACMTLFLAWSARSDSGARARGSDVDARSEDAGALRGSPQEGLRAAQATEPVIEEATPASVRGPTRRVAGRVIDPDGRGVAGAAVLVARGALSEPKRLAYTDSSGAYSVLVDDEARLLWASAQQGGNSRRRSLATVPAEDSCDLSLAQTSRARLTVLSAERDPVEGAMVVAEGSSEDSKAAYLGVEGYYELGPAPVEGVTDRAGRVELAVNAHEPLVVRIAAPGHPVWSFHLAAERLGEPIEAVLPRPGRIEGRVVDDRGVALWNARIEAFQLEDSVRIEAVSEADGSFQVPGLVPGEVLLRAWEEAEWASCLWIGRIEEGSTESVLLTLDQDHTLRGRAVGASLGSTVRAMTGARTDEPVRTAAVRSDGSFVLPGCSLQPLRLELLCAHSPVLSVAIGPVLPGERVHVMEPTPGTWDIRSWVIALEQPPGSRPPTLVELRQLPASIVAPVDPGDLRATFHGLASYPYHVVVWVPGLGAWKAGQFMPAPGASEVLKLRVPETGRVVLEVERTHEALRGLVGFVNAPGFDVYGLQPKGIKEVRVELEETAEGRLEAELFPGEYRYVLRARGAATVTGTLRVESGGEVRETVVLEAGIEIEVVVDAPRPLQRKEMLLVEVLLPDGTSRCLRRSRVPQSFVVCVPPGALELIASTDRGLRGTVVLPALLATEEGGRPRFEIELAEER